MLVTDRLAQRWIAEVAEYGDQMVSDLFAYERLSAEWAVTLPDGLPEHLMYFFVSGSVAGWIGGDAASLRAGSLLWLPPRTPMHLHALGGVGPMLYRFRLATDALYPSRAPVVPQAWPVRSTMDAVVGELSSALPFREVRLRALLVLLFSTLLRADRVSQQVDPLPLAIREQIEGYVDAHLTERPSVAELATIAGLSSDYFSRRFSQAYGLSPKRWLVRRRIQHAMLRLDESDQTVSTISRELGYPDVFLFSRQFKAVVGLSPTAWRSR